MGNLIPEAGGIVATLWPVLSCCVWCGACPVTSGMARPRGCRGGLVAMRYWKGLREVCGGCVLKTQAWADGGGVV